MPPNYAQSLASVTRAAWLLAGPYGTLRPVMTMSTVAEAINFWPYPV